MGIEGRDKVVDDYKPRFQLAAERTVSREVTDIEAMMRKSKIQTVIDYLRTYYAYDHATYVEGVWEPALKDFFNALFVEIEKEISLTDYAYSVDDLKAKFLDDYLERFIERYQDRSIGELFNLVKKEAEEDAEEAIQTRLNEWTETKPAKVVSNETVRSSMGFYSLVPSPWATRLYGVHAATRAPSATCFGIR